MKDLSNAVRTMQIAARRLQGRIWDQRDPGPPPACRPSPAKLYIRTRIATGSEVRPISRCRSISEYVKYVWRRAAGARRASTGWAISIFRKATSKTLSKPSTQVLERYPANNKTPDAYLWKGKTLLKLDKRNAAPAEFREVVRRYPGSEAAANARAQLKQMGLSASPSCLHAVT